MNNLYLSIDPSTWKVSAKAVQYLAQHPEVAATLAQERAKPPFPGGYTPSVIEIYFDHFLAFRKTGKAIVHPLGENLPADYMPSLTQWKFDDQLALCFVMGEMVVNRAELMAELDALLGQILPSPGELEP